MERQTLEASAVALFSHLTSAQRHRLEALDAAYIDLLSGGVPDKADVEALAEAVVALYDLVAGRWSGLENPA